MQSINVGRMQGSSHEELRPFGESIAFMLSHLGTLQAQSFRELMQSVSLDSRSFGILRSLADVGPVTQQRLAQISHVPTSTMVALLDELERAHLIIRHRHPDDRRAHQIALTGEGRKIIEDATALAWSHEERITVGFSLEERKQLLLLLGRVLANFNTED